MPPIRFWFACLAGLITGAATGWTTVSVQLSGTATSIALTTWITIAFAGLVGAVTAGKAAWVDPPQPRSARGRFVRKAPKDDAP